nr:DUF1640 domain-containing protein [Methylosinus sp. Sm6]
MKFVRKLEAGGFTQSQASAAAEAFAEATGQELATKSDLREVETRLEAKIADIRSDIRELELRMTIKLGGLIVVAVGALLAAIRYLPAGVR